MTLWRWRRSPLRRTSDLVEAWVLLAAWALALLGGAAVGVVTAVVADRGAEGERAERREVVAVVVSTVSDGVATRFSDGSRVSVEVRWTVPDGHTRTGRTKVTAGARAGSQVQIWTDARGELTSQPADPPEARLQATAVGVLATAGTGGLVWAGTRAVRGALDRRRLGQWAMEWERIHTHWGGKTS
ncbi:hypothetical protein [Streptomyces sp. NPDC001435]|uniref:Rv1733c family protein n=1 Tax=Streptomyces sp. NPDC001435 TaxID=3364576 RepID=UPI003690FAE2